MSKVFKMQILLPINKVYWNTSTLTHLHIIYDCLLMAELSDCERDILRHSLNYLSFGLLQKKMLLTSAQEHCLNLPNYPSNIHLLALFL